MRLLGPAAGSVIDCGMGPGRLLVELERRGWSVTGVDASAEMVARARARLPAHADQLLQGRLESLPFPSETFDAAVSTGVIEYVEDVPRALAEMARVLLPGGVFVISMPNPRALRMLWRHRAVHATARAVKGRFRFGRPAPLSRPGSVSLSRLENMLADARLDVEQVEYMAFPIPDGLRARFASGSRRAARFERLGRRLGSALAGQFVVAGRKAG
ncbi:MAG TPA: class I SAM-dependent methyltransferase [Thermoleophilaceae bacterium]|nr:class I SAM-dependent methyltransferase [Thermoleophilaceae bacterium]